MSRWGVLALLAILALALALRLPQLEIRPLHNDEAVNAVKVAALWQEGRYQYDPDEYHGPSLHYFSLPFLWLSGDRDTLRLADSTLRWPTVAFGVLLILTLALFARDLGGRAFLWSALLTAVSPAMVFYSRYFIHEMLLVTFTALALGAAWRYLQTRAWPWAMLAGAGLGLMATTKETFVLTLAAAGLAALLTAAWHKPPGTSWAQLLGRINRSHMLLALGVAGLIWVTLFSSFFTNWSGPLDSVRTYFPWLKRAGGHSPHLHPWYFYLQRLGWFHPIKGPVWSEALILGLALIGGGVSLFGPARPLARFLTLFTLALTAIYSAISYKTPWCLLNFHLGFILLAGVGASALARCVSLRFWSCAVTAVLLGLSGQLAGQAWRASQHFASDRRNPYVYAQTGPDVRNLVTRLVGISRVAPQGLATPVRVVAPGSDYWPLPWSLRSFTQIGWHDQLPAEPFPPILIVSSKLDARLDEKTDRRWLMAGLTELRPGVFLELYVELELWKRYVATLPRPTD